jgi:hypothetical protein
MSLLPHLCPSAPQILLPDGAKDVEIGTPAIVLVEEKVCGKGCGVHSLDAGNTLQDRGAPTTFKDARTLLAKPCSNLQLQRQAGNAQLLHFQSPLPINTPRLQDKVDAFKNFTAADASGGGQPSSEASSSEAPAAEPSAAPEPQQAAPQEAPAPSSTSEPAPSGGSGVAIKTSQSLNFLFGKAVDMCLLYVHACMAPPP